MELSVENTEDDTDEEEFIIIQDVVDTNSEGEEDDVDEEKVLCNINI